MMQRVDDGPGRGNRVLKARRLGESRSGNERCERSVHEQGSHHGLGVTVSRKYAAARLVAMAQWTARGAEPD
jgi:hypothetical protein